MKKLLTSSSALWSCLFALAMMFVSQSAMAEYVKLTALNGTGGTGGEGYPKLVDTYDGNNGRSGTKWGQGTNFSQGGEAWIIVKADKAFAPTDYFLVTANDTNGAQGRQWTGWNIFGANFDSDGAAKKDAEAWVLIDQRVDADLTMKNFGVTQFKLDTDPENLVNGSEVAYDGTPYQYFMIQVTSMKTDGQYLQMGEFGFGTYADFQTWLEIQEADPTKPVSYRSLAGYPTGFNANSSGVGGEGYANLLDGNKTNKWCCWIMNRERGQLMSKDNEEMGAYIIFKASRPLAPTYYSLITGNDTGPSGDRNWKQWQIYGMNASSDADVKRESDNWVLLDEKENIGPEQLPAANYALAYFTPSVENTTAYKYFKIEIDKVKDEGDDDGWALMQMTEFALGDPQALNVEKTSIIEALGYDPNVFAEKAFLDVMDGIVAQINACEDPALLGDLNKKAVAQMDSIKASANLYAELTTARNQAVNQLAEDNVADAAVAYVNGWISETDAIAPSADYPVGNFAYIKANRQLTGKEASAEAKRFTTYLQINVKRVDAPISATYEHIAGSGGFGGEDDGMLYDGDRDGTKWCTNSWPAWTVFKSDEPIKPTYYGLVTGSDTYSYPGRNWKSWKIWAANFDSDEDATRESDKWVLIDVKQNIGSEVLKTYNKYESYINLSEGCAEAYQYFKIEVSEAVSGDLIQMNEFTFYNLGNFLANRADFVEEFAGYDPRENPAYIGYIEDFETKYNELKNATSAPDLMKLKNEMIELQDEIATSVELYDEYETIYDELVSTGAVDESESLQAWFDGYTGENIAPNNIYRNGTHDYIMENCPLDNKAMGNRQYLYASSDTQDDTNKIYYDKYKYEPGTGEIGFVENMIFAKEKGQYILVDGNTDEQWGDGYHGNLVDSYFLNDTVAAGDTIISNVTYQLYRVKLGTKWGGNSKGADNTFENTYVIFRTLGPTNPFFYTLTTGDDTARNTNRNWGTWYIYGGNFDGDGNATKDADGWELIDIKENIGQDRLHPVNCQPSYFGFSSETTKEYTYYKVVVTKAFKGTQIQMNDLHFGTPEEFDDIKADYLEKAKDFKYDILAEKALVEKYEDLIEAIEHCINMEALFRANYEIEELQKQITASNKAYVRYEEAVDAANAYLTANNLEDSEAKTAFVNYLTTSVEPSDDLYPNGSAVYILEERLLADSVVIDEIEFIETLKVAAVAAGYAPGCDISSLIVNRTFAKASSKTLKDETGQDIGREAEGWDGYIFRSETDGASTLYAAEFCNYLAKFNVSQTLTGMKNGYYKVTLNAGYRANGDILSYNYAPMAFANDVKTFIPVLREDPITEEDEAWTGYAADRIIYACDIQDRTEDPEVDSVAVAWCMWGCEGAANAFSKGHYAISLVAKVTDGTLTFGVKNDGTQGNEWTGVGNFGLVYLGEETAEAFGEVRDYNDARINTMLNLYESDVTGIDADGNDTYPQSPGFSAAQKETLAANYGLATYDYETAKLVGETMEAISLTKLAYAQLFIVATKVMNKWVNFGSDDATQMQDDVYGILGELTEGSYDDASANAAAEELLAKYPDYMEVQAYNELVDIVPSDDEAFNYLAAAMGRNPSVLIGGNFYDELTEDEVIFAFEYSATEELPLSRFYIGKDADDTQAMDLAIPAAAELTPIYIDLTGWDFGKVDDDIRWRFTTAESEVEVVIRHARMITKAQMKAEGGKPINFKPEKGDVNCDEQVDIADAVTVLNAMAGQQVEGDADVNGDGQVDIADFVTVLNIMAGVSE